MPESSSPPQRLQHLIETFGVNLDVYKRSGYNETQLRREFIDPLFELLGWDVANRQGYAEAYKDVIHEDAIKIGGVTKAPDYCFRIGGTRRFFLEAKKPAVNIKEDASPAYQLRRYGWSARLPLSVLTSFEYLAVYDCRVRPSKTDSAAHSRILLLHYTDYAHRWPEIAGIFAREAILKGAFDRYAAATGAKKGTTPVDTAFLQEMERWRELLARNIALRNPTLTSRELNTAVQQTIDRIVFLRICEDRGIEDYGRLMALQNGAQVYPRLLTLFREADHKYNSGLFHFRPEPGRPDADRLTPNLIIDDKPLRDIFKNLYYPDSPYEFSVLSADILGQVYERFLGKVIRLTAGHQARIEDKPEVRKAGGVFYTPTYIVAFIVQQTVGRLLAGRKPGPRGIGALTILDPACGSGSFLIGAYQYLLDWYRDQYVQADPHKWSRGKSPRLYPSHRGEWRLTTGERKRILLHHIYGVDIDSQAVEVARLSLLMKMLEGEDEQSIGKQMALFQERVLPDLSRNIKCGNSLIGPDIYTGQQLSLTDEETMYRINAFDWKTEFTEILSGGGFDVVVGNPPYVRQESLKDSKSYFQKQYATWHGIADLYVYFIEKGLSLLKSGGLFAYIVANKWLRANYGTPLRQWLQQYRLVKIIDFGDLPVFQQATTYPSILVVQQAPPQPAFSVTTVKTLDFTSLEDYVRQHQFEVQQETLDASGWALVNRATQHLLNKLHRIGAPLDEYVGGKVYYGIKTGLNEAFVIDAVTRQRLLEEDPRSGELIKPFLAGREIKRYRPPDNRQYIILMPKGWTHTHMNPQKDPDAARWLQQTWPAIAAHLKPFAAKALKRCDKGDYWWELRACDYYGEFDKEKIMLPDISLRGNFTLDVEGGKYCANTAYIISSSEKYLLGILNSKLITFFYRTISSSYRGGYLRFIYQYLATLPVRTIDFSNPADKASHNQMTSLVSQILELNQKLAEARTPQSITLLQRQIETTDRQIDQLVYQLYDLTEDEIRIVQADGSEFSA